MVRVETVLGVRVCATAAAAAAGCTCLLVTCTYLSSHVCGLWKHHVVDGVHNVLRRDHAPAEPASVESTNCVFAAQGSVEFEKHLAVVVIQSQADVHDFAVLLLAFALDVVFQLLLPACASLPVSGLSVEFNGRKSNWANTYVATSYKLLRTTQREAVG